MDTFIAGFADNRRRSYIRDFQRKFQVQRRSGEIRCAEFLLTVEEEDYSFLRFFFERPIESAWDDPAIQNLPLAIRKGRHF